MRLRPVWFSPMAEKKLKRVPDTGIHSCDTEWVMIIIDPGDCEEFLRSGLEGGDWI